MKKSIIILSLTALVFSCKKEKSNTFTQTDVTGTTVLKGNVNKNIITPNGSGAWTNNTRVPVSGISVMVKVNKNSLYPNSSAQGADVYTGTTDKDGNYSVSVRSNATGVSAQITIDGFTGTLDTVVNGTTKTGFYSTYAGLSLNRTLFMGQNSQLDHAFTANPVTTNPNTSFKIGTATVTGSVGVNFVKEVATGTVITLTTTNVPVAGRKVYLNLSNDPNLLTTKMYEATTDGNGYYTFTVTTVAAGTSGFPTQNATVWVPDYAATRDTLKANATIKAGRPGVYSQQTLNVTSVFNNVIRNANHMVYLGFTAD